MKLTTITTLAFALMTGGVSLFSAPIFSVQSGGINITGQSVAPAGTQAAPWTLLETMTSGGIIALTDIDNVPLAGTTWITKSVLNNTNTTWTSFEIELREILGTPSGDGDGLSFAQGAGLVFSSDRFSTITQITTTRDYLNFSNGSVLHGQSVDFRFAVRDNSPQSPIFINQTPNRRDEVIPEPASMLLLGSSLALGLIFRKKFKR